MPAYDKGRSTGPLFAGLSTQTERHGQNMSKRIAAMMVGVATVFGLAACGSEDSPQQDTRRSTETEAYVAIEPLHCVDLPDGDSYTTDYGINGTGGTVTKAGVVVHYGTNVRFTEYYSGPCSAVSPAQKPVSTVIGWEYYITTNASDEDARAAIQHDWETPGATATADCFVAVPGKQINCLFHY
jgi:hypothetical protein